MIGTKIYKSNISDYTQCAQWCNENNATIEDKGEYYEVVKIPSHIPTEEEAQIELTNTVQCYLDTTAKQRNYDDILSLCTYATSTNPTFAKEGQAGVIWRDAVWAKCYAILAEVKAGTRTTPTTEELLAELPVFAWGD